MSDSKCPRHEMLVAYQTGELTENSADAVTLHVASCPACQAELKTIRDTEDTLVNQLRASRSQQEPFLDEPGCAAAVAQVQAAVSSLIASEADSTVTISLPPDLRPVGEYQLLGKLGEGGMGAVYKARQTNLGRLVALKVLPKERCQDQAAIARFYREMQAVGRLRHPNIVEALDAREIDGVPVLAMEYVEGIDLSKLVAQVGPLAVPDACELMRQTALGLQHAHEHGLVHRDIKPSNLMLCAALALSGRGAGAEGDHVLVKILDLGLALLDTSRPQDSEMTAAGSAMGTADYMAPEQVTDSHSVDIRADLYSLGCTLYKLLSGHAPFADSPGEGAFHKMMAHVNRPAPSIRQRRPDVPEELAAVLQRLLAKQPDERFATPAEVAAALAPLTAGCDLPGLLRRATGTMPADVPDAVAGTDKYRSSAFVGTDAQPRKAAASATLPRPSSRIPRLPAAIGLAALAFLVLGIVFYLRDGRQTVKVEIDAELVKDATVTVWLDGREMEVRGLGETIRLKPGEHGYEIRRGDQIIRTQEFTVVRGDNPALRITLENSPTVPPPPGTVEVPAVAERPHELLFDGEYAYVETPVKYDGSHPLTLEAWVTLAEDHDSDWHHVISNYDQSRGLALQINPQDCWEVVAKTSDKPDYTNASSAQPVPKGRHHVAMVVEGSQGSLFVDGLGSPAVLQIPEKNSGESSTQPFIMGAYRDAQSQISAVLDGTIDEVRISRVARYRADFVPQERFEPDEQTMALYHFDEGQGCAAHDASGHGNDAQIVGAEWVEVGQKPPLPGLVARPAAIPGLGRWQVATRYPTSFTWGAAWNPDGTLIGCGSHDGFRIYDARTLELVRLLRQGSVWSPDGKWLAGGLGVMRGFGLWDLNGQPGLVFGSGSSITSIAWSPDGQQLATTSYDNVVRLWHVEGKAGPVLVGHTQYAHCVTWSPDGKQLATSSQDGTVRLWKADGAPGPVLEGHTTTVTCVSWRPDGQQLVSGDRQGGIRLWNVDGTAAGILKGHERYIRLVAWSPGGSKLLSADEGGLIKIWNSKGTGEPTIVQDWGGLQSVAWSPDGRQIAAAGKLGRVSLWREDGTPVAVIPGESQAIDGMAWNPLGTDLALCNCWAKYYIRFWRSAGTPGQILETNGVLPRCLAWSPNGEFLAYGDLGGKVRLWERLNNTTRILTGHIGLVMTVAWSHDGSTLASGGDDRTVRLWQADGTPGPVLEGHKDTVRAVTWCPDGTQLASASQDGTIRIWNADGTEKTIIDAGQDRLYSLAWHPDGEWLASTGTTQDVKLWQRDGTPGPVLKGHSDGMLAVAWSPDGKLLATGSGDKTVRLWRLDGSPLGVLRGHLGWITHVVWTSDSKHLISGDGGGEVRMWDVKTGQAEWTAICLKDGRSVTFSPTGEIVHGHPKVIEEELVYLIEQRDGTTELLKPSEFAKLRAAAEAAIQAAPEAAPAAAQPAPASPAAAVGGKPHGTQIAIEHKPGLPDEDGADAATADDAGLWAPGPTKDILLGLVPQPAKLPGVKRWQIDTVAPRADCFSVSWSPDGRLVAWSGYDSVRVYDSQTGRLTRRLSHNGPCQFSPDGKWLGVASWSCAQLWDVRTGRLAINIPGQAGMFSRIAWSPDSSRFVTGGFWGDQSIRVCGIDGKILKAWKLPGMVSDIAWSPDGKWLASSCPEASEETEVGVRLWTPDGGPGPMLDFAAKSLAWSPDGRWLAAGSAERDVSRICLWDTSTWKTAHAWEGPGDMVLDMSWSPDSRRLVFTSLNRPVRIWDIEANSVKPIAGTHELQQSSVAWNRQGTQIAVGRAGHFGTFLCLWDVNSEKPGTIVGSERQPLICLVPSPNGTWLATLSSDGKDGRLWTAEGLPGASIAVQTRRLPEACPLGPEMAWAWNPDGSEAAILGDDAAIRVWKPASAEPARLLRGHTARIRVIDWSRDGKRLVSGGEDRTVRIWDPAEGSILDILTGHADPVDQVAWSPDGKHVASRSSDSKDAVVRLWTADGHPGAVIEGHQRGTKGMAWSPDGTQIATFGNGENDPVRVWNAADGKVVLELKEAYRNLQSLSWSPDNAWLAVVGSDIHVWRRDGTLGRVVKHQSLRSVGRVAWSPDSKWFATAGLNTVCVWSPHQAQPVMDYMGHKGQVTGLCWSPDSRYLVSTGRDGTLQRWHALTGKQISTSVVLPDGSAAYVSQGGKLETTGPEAEKHLVYVVEQPDGEYKLFTPGEFRSTVEANGK